MNITPQQQLNNRAPISEVIYAMLLFGSIGAITWAIRGTSGWGGIDGTILPGMTWGVLWWYLCWRKGIDARAVPLWLGLGIALGGELGYGQYVSWIRGMFNVGDEVIPIAPWLGWAWFAICGIGWAAPGAIALGWALAGRKSLGTWLTRLAIPVGIAILARIAVQTWPSLFFPNWNLGLYVAISDGVDNSIDPAHMQKIMLTTWSACALLCVVAWFAALKTSWIARAVSLGAVGVAIALSLNLAQWLFFPEDQLGLFAGELGDHLGRTVYTNAQNTIVVGWWLGALLVAALQRDRFTLFAGLVIGAGFGIGFPLSAVWCMGYEYAPGLADWWKMWELFSGFFLGPLYVVVLYWAIPQVDPKNGINTDDDSKYRKWCKTISAALAVFLFIYVTAREEFYTVGILLGLFYVVALIWATFFEQDVSDRRRAVSFVYSVFLLIFLLAWGVTAQTGILLGLYDAKAVDQYAWPTARIALFIPAGILIVAAALLKTWQAVRNPRFALPPATASPRVTAHLVDLMTFIGVVGAASIWPAKIGVLYALFLALALFAFNRLNRHFDSAIDNLAE